MSLGQTFKAIIVIGYNKGKVKAPIMMLFLQPLASGPPWVKTRGMAQMISTGMSMAVMTVSLIIPAGKAITLANEVARLVNSVVAYL